MSNRSPLFSWRPPVAILAVAVTAACSGGTPTSPSQQTSAVTPTQATSGTQVQATARPDTGTASTVFVQVSPGVFGFASVIRDGVPGRDVELAGDIVGTNFEPGECVPGVDLTLGFPTSCVLFGTGPGQFIRAHPGGTAVTTCFCTVAGVGDPDDQVGLRISYPPTLQAPQYPAGFTKFNFVFGTGALSGLRGQGTLDFASTPAVSFSYHFTAS